MKSRDKNIPAFFLGRIFLLPVGIAVLGLSVRNEMALMGR
jgi:hypothetical protein